MDELEALNMLLRAIGSSPVNSLRTGHPDAANARATLNRIRRRVQRRGWWYNIDYNVTYQPQEDGCIRIPKEISSIIPESTQYVERGGKLYDKRNQTFLFTHNVIMCRVTRILEWDDMPAVVQEYAAYFAAAEFVRDELEDPQKVHDLEKSAKQSLIDVKKQDLEEGRYNMFNSARTQQARGGVQPYARNNKRFHGDPDV